MKGEEDQRSVFIKREVNQTSTTARPSQSPRDRDWGFLTYDLCYLFFLNEVKLPFCIFAAVPLGLSTMSGT